MDETVEEFVDAVSPPLDDSVAIRRGIEPNPQPSAIAGLRLVHHIVMKRRSFNVLYKWFASKSTRSLLDC